MIYALSRYTENIALRFTAQGFGDVWIDFTAIAAKHAGNRASEISVCLMDHLFCISSVVIWFFNDTVLSIICIAYLS